MDNLSRAPGGVTTSCRHRTVRRKWPTHPKRERDPRDDAHQTIHQPRQPERGLARLLADFLADSFAQVEPLFSSAEAHQSGVQAGKAWRGWINDSLKEAAAAIVLITPESLTSQWLFYEAGFVAASASKRILPLLAGVSNDDIPTPLSDLQAVNVGELSDVQSLVKEIARISGMPVPLRDDAKWTEFSTKMSDAVGRSRVWGPREIKDLFRLSQELRNQSLTDEVRTQLKTLLSGEYLILGRPQVYHHDARVLESLVKGDFYYATHPFSANPGALQAAGNGAKRDAKQGIAFRTYIAAQTDAARRGVHIARLYSVEKDDPILTDPRFLEHLKELEETGIEVRRTEPALFANDGVSDDFVIVGEHGVGMAVPEEGPMIGSRYSLVAGSNTTYDQYLERFKAAWKVSQPFQASTLPSRPPRRTPRSSTDATYSEPAFTLEGAVHFSNHSSRRLMVVLKTGGCAYDVGKHGCTMCDFRHHAADRRVSSDELLLQLNTALGRVEPHPGIGQVDLLSLGSILHDAEVPRDFVYAALERLADEPRIQKVVIESRAEYVSARLLEDLRQRMRPDQILELGLGIETTDDRLRNEVLNKNLSRERIFRSLDACAQAGVHFQSYLLVGTQTLSPTEVVDDAVRSAFDVHEWCSDRGVPLRIALEPVFITHNTVLEQEYNAGRYQLPNLWSVATVLRKTHFLTTVFVGMSDEQLSENRMPVGCPECTSDLRDAIETFNGTQNVEIFSAIACRNCAAG